jgi:hypothetical protein
MTEKTTQTIPEFIPDDRLLAYIDSLPGEVIRWSPEPDSTEFYPMINVEIAPPVEYIEVNFTRSGAGDTEP